MLSRLIAFVLVAMLPASIQAAQPDDALRSGLQSDLSQYLSTRAKAEHMSAVSLSISLPRSASNINVSIGTSDYGGTGPVITPGTLYQIGSNTKSFTAAAILQLEGEGTLSIDQTVGKWLPQYPAWSHITIRRLLNMTSDIPTYDDVPSMLGAYAANPTRNWTPQQLVAVVYPTLAPKPGWLYSNTAYILAQMIVERATGKSYASEIRRRFLNNRALGLMSTSYDPNIPPPAIAQRMTSGYFFSTDADNAALAPLLGKDMRPLSLSWAQGAGAIISTPEDVTRWCRALYEGAALPAKQRREMMTLVSLTSGKPIAITTPQDPRGFGLGVGEMLVPKMGHIWFYEGETLGYRMAYVYLPKQHVVFAIGLNSQPNKNEDHVAQLMTAVYNRLHAAGKV